MFVLAAHDPAEHVLPHRFFELLPFNFAFGAEKVPLLNFPLPAQGFYFTNHLLMSLVAAALCLLIFPRLARAYRRQGPRPQAPRGWVNLCEALIQFIREEVARPVLKQRTDQFMPFLWTLFFFILFCNLLGMVPLDAIVYLASGQRLAHVGGTPTGNIAITGGLAICALLMIHIAGVREAYRGLVSGPPAREAGHAPAEPLPPLKAALLAFPLYVWNFAPHVFARRERRARPGVLLRLAMLVVFALLLAWEMAGIIGAVGGASGAKIGLGVGAAFGAVAALLAGGLHWTDLLDAVMWAFLWVLEAIGAVIKPFALMIRLFANMIAGHIVLASILFLIFGASSVAMGYLVGVVSTLGSVALSGLELFVAFLQAYIFVFLTTLFIGMSVEPEH